MSTRTKHPSYRVAVVAAGGMAHLGGIATRDQLAAMGAPAELLAQHDELMATLAHLATYDGEPDGD